MYLSYFADLNLLQLFRGDIHTQNIKGRYSSIHFSNYSEHHFMLNLFGAADIAEVLDLIVNELACDSVDDLKGYAKIYTDSSHEMVEQLNGKYASVLFTQAVQPPLQGDTACWLHLFTGNAEVRKQTGSIQIKTSEFKKYFLGDWCFPALTADEETKVLLKNLSEWLGKNGLNRGDHLKRTWFYLANMDRDYTAFTDARKEWFNAKNYTQPGHFVSSTGIAGSNCKNAAILMDALVFADGVLGSEHLKALDFLNDTIEYNVTFERGTRLKFSDSERIYISGTASIDNKGNVLHIGDPEKQTCRALENIQALLKSCGSDLNEVVQAVVYVKDKGHFEIIESVLKKLVPNWPLIITNAAVCRPDWLVKI